MDSAEDELKPGERVTAITRDSWNGLICVVQGSTICGSYYIASWCDVKALFARHELIRTTTQGIINASHD